MSPKEVAMQFKLTEGRPTPGRLRRLKAALEAQLRRNPGDPLLLAFLGRVEGALGK